MISFQRVSLKYLVDMTQDKWDLMFSSSMNRLCMLLKVCQNLVVSFGFELLCFKSFRNKYFDQIHLCHLSNCHTPKNSHGFQKCSTFLGFSIFPSIEGFISSEDISSNSQPMKCNFTCFLKNNVEEFESFDSLLMLLLS